MQITVYVFYIAIYHRWRHDISKIWQHLHNWLNKWNKRWFISDLNWTLCHLTTQNKIIKSERCCKEIFWSISDHILCPKSMRQLTNSQWYEQNGSVYKNVQAPDLDKKKKKKKIIMHLINGIIPIRRYSKTQFRNHIEITIGFLWHQNRAEVGCSIWRNWFPPSNILAGQHKSADSILWNFGRLFQAKHTLLRHLVS